MAVTESTARVELFKEIFDVINENKLSGWKILATFPETEPVFPCIVIHPASLTNIGLSFDRGGREHDFEMEIELFSSAKDGFKKIEEGRDNIVDTLRTSANITALVALGIDIKDTADMGTDQLLFNNAKLNMGSLKLIGGLVI